jgi:phosphotransferase system enzyme I (PtsI)
MIPLVTFGDEIRAVRRLIAEESAALGEEGIPHRRGLPVGIMIEVPAAAQAADLLAREADFFSIGTNDLIQYALAVDRGNAAVAYLYQPLHPAVLRMLRFVAEAARNANIPVSLCGEMAADPALTEVLIGLGLTELSVQPGVLAAIRKRVRRIDARRARERVDQALGLGSTAEIVAFLGRVGGGTDG